MIETWKWPRLCLASKVVLRFVFVRLGGLYMPTKLWLSMTKWSEAQKMKAHPLPFVHAHLRKWQVLKCFTISKVCAKFQDFLLLFGLPKTNVFVEKERRKKELKLQAVINGPSHPLTHSSPCMLGCCVPAYGKINCFTDMCIKSHDIRRMCVGLWGFCVYGVVAIFVAALRQWRLGNRRSSW